MPTTSDCCSPEPPDTAGEATQQEDNQHNDHGLVGARRSILYRRQARGRWGRWGNAVWPKIEDWRTIRSRHRTAAGCDGRGPGDSDGRF
eukprot:scaffold27325_cov243-Isochrysis_galbana.AAC.2